MCRLLCDDVHATIDDVDATIDDVDVTIDNVHVMMRFSSFIYTSDIICHT